jgi:hypothetical protein
MGNELALKDDMGIMELGKVMAASGFFTDAHQAGQAVVKILAGRELGFGPVASMTGVYIVKGKVSLSANLMAAAIKRSGRYDYRVDLLTEKGCTLSFYESGKPVGVSSFTLEDAAKAGIDTNATWAKFPRNMLFARAMSNGARWYTPDIFGGPVYTPEELGQDVDGETGEPHVIVTKPQQVLEAETVEPEPEAPAEPMTLEQAADFTTRDGIRYGDMTVDKLTITKETLKTWMGKNQGNEAYAEAEERVRAIVKVIEAKINDDAAGRAAVAELQAEADTEAETLTPPEF